MAQTDREKLLARIDADIAKLTEMRNYVVNSAEPDAEAPKVRKPRGPNKKRGLPATEESTGL